MRARYDFSHSTALNKPMLRITAPHFCAGIVQGGDCAPIIRYMKGWTLRQIRDYCARKGWTVEIIDSIIAP